MCILSQIEDSIYLPCSLCFVKSAMVKLLLGDIKVVLPTTNATITMDYMLNQSTRLYKDTSKYIWAVTCDFQQCGILTSVESVVCAASF